MIAARARADGRWASAAAAVLACAALLFLVIRARHGLWLPGFSDESMHLLGGRALNEGGRLYVTFIDAHGPLIFMMSEIYGALIGWSAPNWIRLAPLALALLAAAAIFSSRALPGVTAKLWGVAVFLGLLAALWLMQGLYLLNFYPVAGFLAAMGLAGFMAGLWRGAGASIPAAAGAGLAFALLVSAAYSFGLSVALFALSAWLAAPRPERGRLAWAFLAGAALGAAGMAGWLLVHGSLTGYLAFHIAFNQISYEPYSGASVGNFYRSLMPSLEPARCVHTLGLLLWSVSCALFVGMNLGAGCWRRIVPVLIGHAGVLLLNARGLTIFQDATFLIAAIALVAVAVAAVLSECEVRGMLASVAVPLGLGLCIGGVELAVRQAISTPLGMTRAQMAALPRGRIAERIDVPVFNEVRRIVPPGERILALVYWPDFYWAADRLPMDGFYEYLPWDADYARSPWFGQRRDICEALSRAPPKVIAFDNVKLWDKYAAVDFMPCVLRVLTARYRPLAEDARVYMRQ